MPEVLSEDQIKQYYWLVRFLYQSLAALSEHLPEDPSVYPLQIGEFVLLRPPCLVLPELLIDRSEQERC
jgi:hypothetical protein